MPDGKRGRERGFTLVELVVALVILAVGLLGLAGTTGFVIRQTTLSDLTTERAAVVQTVVERIRATPFEDVAAGSATREPFEVRWQVTASAWDYKEIEVVTVGPGLASSAMGLPTLQSNVTETFTFQIVDVAR